MLRSVSTASPFTSPASMVNLSSSRQDAAAAAQPAIHSVGPCAHVRGERGLAREGRHADGHGGHATASEGTGAVWGAFSTQVQIPASVRCQVTLEVFEAVARDGTPMGLAEVPFGDRLGLCTP